MYFLDVFFSKPVELVRENNGEILTQWKQFFPVVGSCNDLSNEHVLLIISRMFVKPRTFLEYFEHSKNAWKTTFPYLNRK